LLADGVVNGVGSVAVFLPNIFILFRFISVLEDSGYMAGRFHIRQGDHALGSRQSFHPMIMGFGCNGRPSMATRTLETQRDRILAIMINPLISCSGQLPIYILFAGRFQTQIAGCVASIYFWESRWPVAMGRPFFQDDSPRRGCAVRHGTASVDCHHESSVIHMWDRGKISIRKLSGVILVGSVLICSRSFRKT